MTGLLDLSQELTDLIISYLPSNDLASFRALNRECSHRCETAFVKILQDLRFINAHHSMDALMALASHDRYAPKLQSLRLGTHVIRYDGPTTEIPLKRLQDFLRYSIDEQAFRLGSDLSTLTAIMMRMPRTSMQTIDIGSWDQASEGRCYGVSTYERDTLRAYKRCGQHVDESGDKQFDGIDQLLKNVMIALSITGRTITEPNVRQLDWETQELYGFDVLQMSHLSREHYDLVNENTPLARGLRRSFISLRMMDLCIALTKPASDERVDMDWFLKFLRLAPNLECIKLTHADGYEDSKEADSKDNMTGAEQSFEEFWGKAYMPRLKSFTLQNFSLAGHHECDLKWFLDRHTTLVDVKLHRVLHHFDWAEMIRSLPDGRTLPDAWKLTLSWLERLPGPEDDSILQRDKADVDYHRCILFNDDGKASECNTCRELLFGFTLQECKTHTSKTFHASDLKEFDWTLAPSDSLLLPEEFSESDQE